MEEKSDQDVLCLCVKRRALRRWRMQVHMHRRLREDRNQHYDAKEIARFREQPKLCSCFRCGNPRRFESYTFWIFDWSASHIVASLKCRRYVSKKDRLTRAELRALLDFEEQLEELHMQ
ncbi:MAG: hypothetical protein G01um101448_834 [Parcubacteria group bacterium Gr01-1014_48]|nr:MAG: hypothetical protein G01um101448_834 [Parcubacteria group bacterium Gr01-1014_48]TSD07749.1 MAG: hypothetical protein Greene07144_758 [Parcubacteria group bacterium Greene0714_4]